LLVPLSDPPVLVAVMVRPVPAPEIVTLPVQTPAMKFPVVVGLIVDPPDTLRSAVPVNEVTVLLEASWAVIVILKGVNAVCGALIEEIAK
jgi:hypothetical protein